MDRTLTVCVAVACIGSMTAIASDTIAWHDPASAQARQSSSYHEVMATVTTPVIASDQRTYDCQTDIRRAASLWMSDVRSTVLCVYTPTNRIVGSCVEARSIC
ncbi:MAG: hypothetical protein ACLS6O_05685 [Bifidobacterium sp.]